MADHELPTRPRDPELERQLERLRNVPSRDPHTVARNQARFIAEVDAMLSEQGLSKNARSAGNINLTTRWKERWNMATPRFRTVFTFAAVFATLVIFLFGGAGMTTYAAQAALPGDALYGLKTGVEQTRVTLAGDAAERARLNLAFAERRLDEIARLIDSGRYTDISQAVAEYEQYVQNAIAELETVASGDPARAQELTALVANSLRRYAATLAGMIAALPEAARTEVERAIQVSHTASGFEDEIEFTGTVEEITATYWMVSGRKLLLSPFTEIKGQIVVGSLVKVHAWQDSDGSFVMREVELASEDDNDNDNDNGNLNGNENDNDNDNDNGNENDNDNGNENDNDNGNENENDNGNENENDNGNENENDNDNGNSNLNDNDNDNDNDNGNGNYNDNDDDNDNGNGNNNDNDNNDNDDDDNDNDHDNDNDDDNENDNDGDD